MHDYGNIPQANYHLMDLALRLASIEAEQYHGGASRYSSETVSAFYDFMLRKREVLTEALRLAKTHF